ncbi:MAG: threonine-phosphate decarboxylase CobD [Bacillota bacterium]
MAVDNSHGGNLKAAANKYNLAAEQIIDFSANINFLGPPSVVADEIKRNLEQIIHYPEPEAKSLSRAVADYWGVASDEIIIGNGAVELIYLLAQLINPRRAMVLAPTFSEYERALNSVGSEVELFKLERKTNFQLEISSLVSSLNRQEIELLFLANPNNPTGDLVSREELLDLLQAAEQNDILVVLDEAFLDFLPQEEDYTLIQDAVASNNLFILRSMTKFFAIPGLRVGYGVANQELISDLKAQQDPWTVNLFAQQVGQRVLETTDYIERTKQAIAAEKEYLYQQLVKLPQLQPFYPAANYILIEIANTKYSSPELQDCLGQQGILVRDCSTYYLLGTDFIRVAVKSREDNQRLIAALEELL